jgi:hypothetical protein
MAYNDGTLLKSNDRPEVWLISGGQRHWIPSPDIFNADGFSWAAILVVSDAEIAAIPQGPDVPLYTTWITPGPNDPALPGPQLPTVNYNGQDYKRWRSGGGGHTIYARGEFVTQTGAISGETITMNAVAITGYHSGTTVLITDGNDIIRWNSPVFRVGVNPQGVFSTQTVVSYNSWNFDVPQNIADVAAGFAVALGDSPDNLQQIMKNSLGAVLSALTPLVTAIGGIFAGSKKPAAAPQTSKTTTSSAALSGGWETPPVGANVGHV